MTIVQKFGNMFDPLFNYFRSRNTLNIRLQAQQEQIRRMEQWLQIKLLQARMNPHFLFNSLNAIQFFVMDNDKKASLQYIRRFGLFLRKVINCGDELFITVKDEVELLNEYLWLEHRRFPDRFTYEILADPSTQDAAILPLLTHGLVEEALYRRVLSLPQQEQGHLVIRFSMDHGQLQVSVTDNGLVRNDQQNPHEKDVTKGEEYVQRRIRIFNQHAKNKIGYTTRTDNRDHAAKTISSLHIPYPLENPVNTITDLKTN